MSVMDVGKVMGLESVYLGTLIVISREIGDEYFFLRFLPLIKPWRYLNLHVINDQEISWSTRSGNTILPKAACQKEHS